MQRATRGGVSGDYPFLGIGISASGREAETIARARASGDATDLPALDFLNIGVSTLGPPPATLRGALSAASLPCVAHLEEVNLVGHMDEARLERVLALCAELGPCWLQEDLGVWVWKGAPLGHQMLAPILDAESLAQAARNISRITELSPAPFLAENPPFYSVLGDIDLLTFMAELAERTGCGLILDIGHLVGYCTCVGKDPRHYVDDWRGFAHLVEVHLAGHRLYRTDAGAYWEDAHEMPVQNISLEVLDRVLLQAPSVKAITLEVEGAPLPVLHGSVRAVSERVQALQVSDGG